MSASDLLTHAVAAESTSSSEVPPEGFQHALGPVLWMPRFGSGLGPDHAVVVPKADAAALNRREASP